MTNNSTAELVVTPETLPAIAHNGRPVVTTALLAKLYGTEDNNLIKNFQRNADRFVAGKHYHKLEGVELKAFRSYMTNSHVANKYARQLILWTERGAARHAKMLDTDQAWNVFEKLEDGYFGKAETAPLAALPPAGLTPAHQRHIQNRVTDMANGSRKAFAGLYRSIKDHFGVGSYKDVPEDRYPALCALLMCKPMEGEWLSSEPPQPEQAQSLEISYPVSWLAEHNRHAYQFGYRPHGQDPHIHVTAKALYGMDSRSPSMALFGRLDKAGYDVDACRLEVMAMRHHLEKYGQLCRTLQQSLDIGANNGITFKLTEAAQAMRA